MLRRLKFRYRIAALVALAGLALLGVTLVAVLLGRASQVAITGIETRYLPLLELDRDLKAQFARIPPALEGAAATAEESQLVDADRLRDQFVLKLSGGQATIAANGGDAAELLRAFRAYYEPARALAAALIAAESPESLEPRVAEVRAAQQRFALQLDHATSPDRTRMAGAFATARRAQRDAILVDLAVASGAFVLMMLLSLSIVRRAVKQLAEVSQGMDRLAQGQFGEEITVAAADEFGELARRANQTAVRLRQYREEREREDWIKSGVGALAAEMAGDLDSATLGRRALAFLARQLDAPVAVAYASDEAGGFRLLHTYGAADATPVPLAFRGGEGQIGRAAHDDEVRVLADLPADYLTVRSALGAMPPRHLVIVPFGHEGRAMGVLELGLIAAPGEAALELLRRSRSVLGVAFRVAESRARAQLLLEETQRQAAELRDAYDTLERRNQTLQESEERLQAQQEELRQTNEELEEQTAALEAQRLTVQKQNDELLEIQAQLEDKAAELARASRYKSEFLANMSHELRTPLNSIMILSKILGEPGERPESEKLEFARVIHKSGEELLALINDVLDLAKVEAGRQDLSVDTLVVADLVGYLKRMFQPMAADKGLVLDVVMAEGAPEAIRTDRARLEQILKNLVANAIKFTAQGRVTVRVYRAKDALAIAVADTGVGIPADKQAWIFEAFAQVEAGPSRKYGGTGLGLTIARQLARRLGGDLQVESQVGQGSTFQLFLPLAGPPADEAPAPAAPRPARATPSQPPPLVADDRHLIVPGDACLLVIEDDPHFAELVLRTVREDGFKGLVATTGHEGLELARRHKPSGIVLDVGLPDLDGWAVMERLKQERTTREIPVHFITAGDDRARAHELGAVGFLAKPVDAAQIRGALQALEASAGASLRRVLVVESDAAMRDSLREQLQANMPEVAVAAVGSSDAALAQLSQANFGCVVLDLALPGKHDGMGFLARVRADERTAAMPAIVHTALDLSPEEVMRLEINEQALVILQGERSFERVLEETRLFLQRVRSGLPEQRQRMIERVHQHEPLLKGKTVLIVDDDMRNVYSLSSALRAKDLRVLTAADGQEALDELETHPETNVVLMDVMMPRMDGHEATRRIREEPRFQKLPIIALTAKTMPGERKKCLDAGANDYVPKPVDLDRLLALLRVWLS
jgi:signal transduction histidine kinase/CheY-like chemotaxis protein